MRLKIKSNSRVTIDGKTFTGRSVSIVNGKVTVDGQVQAGELIDEVNIVVHGDVQSLENSVGTVTAQNVNSIQTQAGDVKCADVAGSVSTVSGNVVCGRIGGSTSIMSGDISHR